VARSKRPTVLPDCYEGRIVNKEGDYQALLPGDTVQHRI
jgi:hypothetical protein